MGSTVILDLLKNQPGGFSYRPISKSVPQSGYMSSISDGPIFSPSMPDNEAIQAIDDFLVEKADILKGDNVFVGGWLNEEDGLFYLDASQNVYDLQETIRIAAPSRQKAIFDLNTFQTIYVSDYLDANPDFDVGTEARDWYAKNKR